MVNDSLDSSGEDRDDENVRLTISIPKPLYAEVKAMAKRDARSLAFIIRRAIESQIRDEQPLLYPKSQ